MAIDTRDRRSSTIQAYHIPYVIIMPEDDGTISGNDKQHLVWLYRGIAAASPSPDHLMLKGMGGKPA